MYINDSGYSLLHLCSGLKGWSEKEKGGLFYHHHFCCCYYYYFAINFNFRFPRGKLPDACLLIGFGSSLVSSSFYEGEEFWEQHLTNTNLFQQNCTLTYVSSTYQVLMSSTGKPGLQGILGYLWGFSGFSHWVGGVYMKQNDSSLVLDH